MTAESRRLRRKARGYRIFAVLFCVLSLACLLTGIVGCITGDQWAWACFVFFVTWVVLAGLYAWMGDQAEAEAHRIEWQPILDHIEQIQAKLAKWLGES